MLGVGYLERTFLRSTERNFLKAVPGFRPWVSLEIWV